MPLSPDAPLAHLVPDTTISQRAKAAIVVRLLINEGADIPLEELPESLQAELTRQMGAMRVIDRATLAHVVEEFADALDAIGLSFPGGIAGALDALEGRISRETAKRLRKEAGVRAAGDPWKRLRALDADALSAIITAESTEVAAVLLSKLDVPKAAALLGQLPGPVARQITYAVSLTADITPDAVDCIGLSLATQLDERRTPAFDTGAAERLGAILNSSSTPTRDDMLDGLQQTDEVLADAVRRAIFTFGNIEERVSPRDIPRILREVDPDSLRIAMAGAEEMGFATARDYILENMSSRMADQLREEIEESGKVKAAEADAAMSTVVAAIRAMEERGELVLNEPEEDDSDAA
ncbi:flagellar motor switch protein FliG [Sulfitobacter albidus]|uniref:Flagellar motor switch protein FliG n=2 Tax=Sulfitobacter albidus TaxID=2829501 RepID=A0A975PNK6_9RHOB|nr:flagellar motor switch protein FliG [Sulfitobacter albidus]